MCVDFVETKIHSTILWWSWSDMIFFEFEARRTNDESDCLMMRWWCHQASRHHGQWWSDMIPQTRRTHQWQFWVKFYEPRTTDMTSYMTYIVDLCPKSPKRNLIGRKMEIHYLGSIDLGLLLLLRLDLLLVCNKLDSYHEVLKMTNLLIYVTDHICPSPNFHFCLHIFYFIQTFHQPMFFQFL